MTTLLRLVIVALLAILPATPASADLQAMRTSQTPGLGDYDREFWPGSNYRPEVRSPGDFLGFELGSRPAQHEEILRYFEYLDGLPTAELHTMGETYEGRSLVYLVVSSEENAARLGEIRESCAKLADPRLLAKGDSVQDVIARTPAVAWMAYGIHGDELSSCDAGMQLAYQLVAGTDTATRAILKDCVVIIDPVENPDGRTRWLTQLAQWNSVIPSHDIQSISHTGMWPYGRTNHYLFDMNRDWFSLVHPESRARTQAILEWMPQYLLDCHEMGPLDTYLFSPPREPFNPHMVNYIHKWWARVASEHAEQFDNMGWSYYTREWNEEMYPGYGSSWAIYIGAVGFLFEQAGVDGSQVKRQDGTVMTFRETVHHQFVGSMANLIPVAAGRAELLADYQKQKADNLRSKPDTYVFTAGGNQSRLDQLVATLQHQKIEVLRANKDFKLPRARAWDGRDVRDVAIPAGSALVRTDQPLRQLIEAILDFDTRIPTSFLETEKKEILERDDSRLYDTTGWSLPLAYGLVSYRVAGVPGVASEPYIIVPRAGSLDITEARVGFAFDGSDDRAFELLARLFETDIKVWCANKPFRAGALEMPRGSYLIRRAGNPGLDTARLRELAEAAGVTLVGVNEGIGSGRFADLGGNEFTLLKQPRIALVGGNGINQYNLGAVWHLLDSRLRMRTSTIDIANLGRADLSRYNVLFLPDNYRGVQGYQGQLGDDGVDRLKSWIEAGGTVVAEGAGAAFMADTSVAISPTRMRRQVLKKLPEYRAALETSKMASSPVIDSLSLWEAKPVKTARPTEATAEGKKSAPDDDAIEREDEIARKLAPRGTIVAIDLDTEHWLAYGCAPTMPALLIGNRAFVTRTVRVPARLAPADRLRLSGLLWEEARTRWAETAYATRDGVGSGQAILFTSIPNFRGYYRGTERLLLNALLLGPGMGTDHPVGW
ncbi:MAG: M14 family metallopeptidase [Candidatus Krumholzibacteria bacterium]|nr:M14 family metallopeptidase [Candidatus Krumholzibacteria bacterium]MDH4337034.1 M14 family metallopeptidase [Candidatus Krumholzibacteria bacterium]MDH5268571.1 M14 family metallopeptidase [Candidatus Krumholzibacteria bacterium]